MSCRISHKVSVRHFCRMSIEEVFVVNAGSMDNEFSSNCDCNCVILSEHFYNAVGGIFFVKN